MTKDTLKHWAEDAAFQFKALHKTADIYHYLYRISTILILLIAVCTLAFQPDGFLGQTLGVIALLLTVALIFFQQDIEKTRAYRTHADKYKSLYDQLELLNSSTDPALGDIQHIISDLREQNTVFPISKIAHWWTNKVIRKEMNLDWIYKQS